MKNMSKLKHQVKSSRYYIFWGAATIAVMAGQIYVAHAAHAGGAPSGNNALLRMQFCHLCRLWCHDVNPGH